MKKHESLLYPKILVINSGDRDKITLGLVQESQGFKIAEFNNRAQDLALNIQAFLKKNKLQLNEISALAIARNGNSLTGIRMGIATVNSFAYLLDLPIIELDGDNIIDQVSQLKNGKHCPKTVRQTTPLG